MRIGVKEMQEKKMGVCGIRKKKKKKVEKKLILVEKERFIKIFKDYKSLFVYTKLN